MRINFGNADETGKIKSRAIRDLENWEARRLAEEVTANIEFDDGITKFRLKTFKSHRGILTIRANGCKLSGEVTNTDPGYIKDGWLSKPNKKHWKKAQQCRTLKDTPEARQSARLINEFTKKASDVLRKSAVNRRRERKRMMAANIILVRDTGDHLPKLNPFYKKHGLKVGAFAQMPCEKAIARLADIKQILPKSPTCSYKRLAKVVATQIVKLDGVYIHLKGPDEYGHSKDPKGKRKAIEKIDKEFFSPLLAGLDLNNTIIAVTSDHATECKKGIHTSTLNPILIYTSKTKPASKKKFCEKECKKGQLKTIEGKKLIRLLKKLRS